MFRPKMARSGPGFAAWATAAVSLRGAALAGLVVLSVLSTSSAFAQETPNAPTDVGATAFSTSLTVIWQAPSGGPEPTGYRVTLLEGAIQVGQPIETGASTFSATFRGLERNTTYNVTVAALNGQTVGPMVTEAAHTSGPISEPPVDVTTLYVVDLATDALYAVDTASGAATRVGDAVQFNNNEGNPTALAAVGGDLYMLGADTKGVHRLDPKTGVVTESIVASDGFGVNEEAPSAWPP